MWRGNGRWTRCSGCDMTDIRDLQIESFADGFCFIFFVRGIGMPAGIIWVENESGLGTWEGVESKTLDAVLLEMRC